MLRAILCLCLVLVLALVPATGAAKKKRGKGTKKGKPAVECINPDTDEKVPVVVPKVKKAIPSFRKALVKKGIHMLDLSDDAHHASRKLTAAIAAKDWCAATLAQRELEDALVVVEIESEFVNQKFSRVERWVRGGEWSEEKRTAAERELANAAAEISAGRHVEANDILTKLLLALFEVGDLWTLPETIPEVADESGGSDVPTVDEWEVEEGCPKLAEQGHGTASDLTRVQAELRRAMDARKVRMSDIRKSEPLLRDLHSYVELDATWPAVRVACVLLARVKAIEIDLSFTMGRYQLVNRLRRAQELDEKRDDAFRVSIRAASDAVAARDFTAAHAKLEEAMVFLGEPAQPSATFR